MLRLALVTERPDGTQLLVAWAEPCGTGLCVEVPTDDIIHRIAFWPSSKASDCELRLYTRDDD